VPLPPAATTAVAAAADAGDHGARTWIVAVHFGAETFRNGMDPLALLAYLDKLGSVLSVTHDHAAVPTLEQLDPETCHLAVELRLRGEVTQEQIESAFSFVREDCQLQVRDADAAAPGPACADEEPAIRGEVSQAHGELRPPAMTTAAEPDKSAKARTGVAPAAEEQRFIRVQADRLDAVINLLGELVIASAGASMLAQQTRQRALAKANQSVGRLIEEIRNSTLQLRMVPIGETFSRFRRVVRDTAAELGKDVVLELQGGETELDKSVVERIADPLMHLVRNALDHGLERPDERLAAGKPGRAGWCCRPATRAATS
jgi:two-component system chemotaxis sensor kinase CheA